MCHLSTMFISECGLLLICTSLSMASFHFHRHGWLDKVVEYHKNKLFEDFRNVPDVEIKATIEPAPKGYVDSPDWDFDSVTRLLILIRESKTALPVRRVLRRILGNTRRRMTFQESFKAFPSLSKDVPNDIYYDASGEFYGDVVTEEGFMDKDVGVIKVANPVEARLPSALISISLLRTILEERAKAARYMPTTRKTIPWKVMTTKTTSAATTAQNSTIQEGGATSAGKTDSQTGSPGNTDAPGTGTATAAAAATTAVAA